MKKRIFFVLLSTLMVFACILTSCSGGNTNVTDTDDSTDTASDSTENVTDTDGAFEVIHKPVQNPVFSYGADPWVIRHEDEYYYCYSSGNGVAVAKINSPAEISPENGQVVYTAPEGTMYSANYWAPELHYINGEWYIYVAADDGNHAAHRMYVLRGTTQSPTDPFEMVGKISDSTDYYAIDGTVLQHNDSLYFVWSGWARVGSNVQDLYIAHMSDPCTIDSERVRISKPDFAWEKVGFPFVNEGPVALTHQDNTYIVYSASVSWTDDYCLGMVGV